jgi:fucose permease
MAWLTFGSYFLIGTLATLFPSVMPGIIRGFGLSLVTAGLIFPANAVGSVLGGLGAGAGSDRLGRKPFLCAGALVSGAALLALWHTQSWPLFVGAFLLLGLGQGALSNSVNALVLDLNATRRGAAMNGLHGTFSLGAMVSPFLIRLALGPGMEWRPVVLGAALVWLAFGLATLCVRCPVRAPAPMASRRLQWDLLRNQQFAMIFAVGFIYNGVSWSLLGWIKESLHRSGARPEFGSALISIFYVGLATGRFACARWAEQWTYGRTLVICAVGASLTYPLAVFGGSPAWVAVGVLLAGLFQSGLYPTGLAYATRLYPGLAGTVTGTLSVGMTAGASIPPWWTGAIGSAVGLPAALQINALLLAPLTLLCLRLAAQERKGQSNSPRT